MAQLAKKRKASTALETGASTPRKAQERGIRVYARVSKPVAAASKAIEGKKNGIVAVVEHGSGVDDGDDDGGPREEGPTAMKIKKRKLERATGIVVAVDNGDAPEAGSMGEDVAAAAVADQSSCRSTTTLDRLQSHGLSRSMQMKKVILLAGAAKVSTATARARANVSAQERGKSLLERIRAKEQRILALPPPPSKAQQERQAALQRLPDIVPIINFLSTASSSSSSSTSSRNIITGEDSQDTNITTTTPRHTQQKVSFPLPVLIGHLRDSLRNPISAEEGERSVRLLAEEVAPEWVALVTMGKVVAAVVKKGFRPDGLDLKRRLEACS